MRRIWLAVPLLWMSHALVMAQGSPTGPIRGDFNGDGLVGNTDLRQLRSALGTTDPHFDLDDDGTVDIDDFFHLAQLYDELEPPEPPPLPFKISETSHDLSLTFEKFEISLQFGAPFGITSLHLTDQPDDFVHPELPLADWEWFWYEATSGRRDAKLLQPAWGAPRIEATPEHVRVTFQRPDVLRRGIDLSVEYWFFPTQSAFHVTYQIANGTRSILPSPYVMVGFPGFSNQGSITGVKASERRRTARWGDFASEAIADGRPEYLLLREDATHARQGMSAGVQMHTDSGLYQLQTYFVAHHDIRHVFTAHTNKPSYLTSHLYATLADLAPGDSHRLLIYYILKGPPPP